MLNDIKYIELKTGYSDDGPAWIGRVSFSRSGRTIYFNGKAFKSTNGQGIEGNYRDIETGEEYWISGIKKKGSNRLGNEHLRTKLDKNIVKEFLDLIGSEEINLKTFELVDIKSTDKAIFSIIENK